MNLANILDFQTFLPFPAQYSLSTESSGTTSDESSSVVSSLSSSPNHSSYELTQQIPVQFKVKSNRKPSKETSYHKRHSSKIRKSFDDTKTCEKRCPKLKINLRKGQSVLIEPEDESPKPNFNLKIRKTQKKFTKKWTNPNYQPTIAEKVKLRKRSCRSDISSESVFEGNDVEWPLEIFDHQPWPANYPLNDIQIENKHNLELNIFKKEHADTFPINNELLPPELLFIAKDLMSDFDKVGGINPVKMQPITSSFMLPTLSIPDENSIHGCVADAIQSILGNTFNEEDEYHDAKKGICQLLENGVLKDTVDILNESSPKNSNISSNSGSEETVPLEIAISKLTQSFEDIETKPIMKIVTSEDSSAYVIPSYELELDVASYVVISDTETQPIETSHPETETLVTVINLNTPVSSNHAIPTATQSNNSIVKQLKASMSTNGMNPGVPYSTATSKKEFASLSLKKQPSISAVSEIPIPKQTGVIRVSSAAESSREKYQKLGSGAVFSSIVNKDITMMLDSLDIPSPFKTASYTQLDERLRHSSSSSNDSAHEMTNHSFSANATGNKSLPRIKTECLNTPRPSTYHDYSKKANDEHAYEKKQKEVVIKKSVLKSENLYKRKSFETPSLKRVKSVFMPSPSSMSSKKSKTLQKRDSNQYSPHVNARKRESYSPKEDQRNKAMQERRVVYVGEIPPSYTIQQLRERFSLFGPIENIQIKSKDCDTKELVFLSPINKLKSPGRGIWSPKQGSKNFFGFITYQRTADATKAIEKGNEGSKGPVLTLNFGGRRQFVKDDYQDLDAKAEQVVTQTKKPQKKTDDFACLLEQEKRRLGL